MYALGIVAFATIILAVCGIIVSFSAHSLGGITIWMLVGGIALVSFLTITSELDRRRGHSRRL